MGIRLGQQGFQKKNQEEFGDIFGVHIIAADMIVAASTLEEQDEILQRVLECAGRENVRFNPEKLQFKVSSVQYMGHILSADGMKPDPTKLETISKFPTLQGKGDIHFLGMMWYLAQYVPKESKITAPLRKLLRKDVGWHWDNAISKLGELLSQAPVIRFFDQQLPVTLQADVSK
uniref:Reverse transcriptase domain-containing protein n=1 Tax=Latimeria chalumnae TaxID=7897 RepID=H3AE74_LATCH